MVIEHIIAGQSIPHNEGAIPLTKESYNINEPEKRLTDFSKTIVIPEDNVVNQIFEHAFDVNVTFQTFNPNKKTSYKIVQDGITLMDGYCQLREINEVNGLVQYSIQATGKTGNIFEEIKDLYLTDLDFSTYDHAWTYANILASWTPTLGQGYVYPMIDLGGRTFYDSWAVTDFKPAFFVKEYFTKIFSDQGYTISSVFFDTTLFKSLIVPYASDVVLINNDSIKELTFSVGRSGTQTVPLDTTATLIFNDDNSPFYNTVSNEYDTTTGIYTPVSTHKLSLQGLFEIDLTYTQTNANVTQMLNTITSGSSFNANIPLSLIEDNGTTKTVIDVAHIDITSDVVGVTLGASTSINNLTKPFSMGAFEAVAGNTYFLKFGFVRYDSNSGTFSSSDFAGAVKEDSNIQSNLLDVNFSEGDTVDSVKFIPTDVKQKNFVSSIIKKFNLYLDYDTVDDKLIYIEPRADYLLDTGSDLTPIVDRSKEYIIKPLGQLDANEYIFRDKEDKDKHNQLYIKAFDEIYGQRKVDIDNDFLIKQKVVETIFSPTPLETIQGKNDRVISSIRFEDDEANKVEGIGKIRLLYWGGLLPTSKGWNVYDATTSNGQTSYPYAGHLDNPYNPTFDLNWGVPKRIYYDFSYGGSNTVTYPSSNCYNEFWSEYITQLTDKNSKLLECFLALRPSDYADLSFRNKYYIDGSSWRLLKISDYNVESNQTTKCLFIKADPQAAFTGQVVEMFGGSGEYDTEEKYPELGTVKRPNNGSGDSQDSVIYGDDVKSGQRSVIVSDNVVNMSGSVNNFAMSSNDSSVMGTGVTLINTNGANVIRDGEVYVNDLFVEKQITVTLNETVMENLTTTTEILPDLRGNEYYEITRGYVRLDGTSATAGVKVSIITSTTNTELASIPATFFDTTDNVGEVDIVATSLDFGEGISIESVSDMEMPDSDTIVTIKLVYRIVQI